jgi:hypothetical protein
MAFDSADWSMKKSATLTEAKADDNCLANTTTANAATSPNQATRANPRMGSLTASTLKKRATIHIPSGTWTTNRVTGEVSSLVAASVNLEPVKNTTNDTSQDLTNEADTSEKSGLVCSTASNNTNCNNTDCNDTALHGSNQIDSAAVVTCSIGDSTSNVRTNEEKSEKMASNVAENRVISNDNLGESHVNVNESNDTVSNKNNNDIAASNNAEPATQPPSSSDASSEIVKNVLESPATNAIVSNEHRDHEGAIGSTNDNDNNTLAENDQKHDIQKNEENGAEVGK